MQIDAHPLFKHVVEFIESRHMLDGIEHVDVALSGGADSVCLLAILASMKHSFELRAHHIRHHLRESDGIDAEIARETARLFGVQFIQTDLEWPDGVPHENVEENARKCRYEAFFGALNGSSSSLALAHHGDENLETAIWRLGRGCGLEGLSLAPVSVQNGVRLIRPLLVASKDDVYQFLNDTGLKWAEDPSNQSDLYRRNRIRHTILPAVKQEAMSDACLYRSLIQIRSDADALSSLADSFVMQRMVYANGWFCKWQDWQILSEAAKIQVLRHASRRVLPGLCPDARFIDRVLVMFAAQKQTCRQLESGPLRMGWCHGGIMVWTENHEVSFPEIELELPCSDARIWNLCELTSWKSTPDAALKNTTSIFHVDASVMDGRISILPAEKFREVRNSIGNIIKLRESLRSQGVPDMWRRHWPVLCVDGRPIWVIGGMRTLDAKLAHAGFPAYTFSVKWL